MSELKDARARLKAIGEGHYVPKGISVEEAKKQLRAADPSIDISDLLRALHRGEALQKAAAAIAVETLSDPEAIHYWSPVLAGLVQALIPASSHKAAHKSESE